MDIGSRYLTQCKANYMKEITPSNLAYQNDMEYLKLIEIGKQYFKERRIDDFSFFLGEGQYFVALWTAHIILEYGNANDTLIKECIDVIKEYSDNPLSIKVSKEEQAWLKINLNRFEN